MEKKAPIIAQEPYRIFFPFALLAGIFGVMLWPAFYWEWIEFYPLHAHTRLMIQGFVGGFAVGFLGTAMPKMLSTKPFHLWQVILMATMHIAYCTSLFFGNIALGDSLFAAMILMLMCLILARVFSRREVPPPAMTLAGLGLLSGAIGAIILSFFSKVDTPILNFFAQRLLYQVFILLPLLGVGSFFFPMVLGTKNLQSTLSGKAWKRKAGESLLLGILIITTYWIEAHGEQRFMSWIRFILCLNWFTKETGWLKITKTKGVMTWALRAGIVCLLSGMIATGIMLQYRIALEHTLYIGGFGLITMIVATRVIYGHSGQGNQFQKWIKPLVICVGLLLLGMATRVSADFMPKIRNTHLIYAAACWVIVSIIWALSILPSIRKKPPTKPTFTTTKPTAKAPSILDMDFRKK